MSGRKNAFSDSESSGDVSRREYPRRRSQLTETDTADVFAPENHGRQNPALGPLAHTTTLPDLIKQAGRTRPPNFLGRLKVALPIAELKGLHCARCTDRKERESVPG